MLNRRSSLLLLLVFAVVILVQCNTKKTGSSGFTITDLALAEKNSPFYINKETYKSDLSTLPIGVFDSGTGGLAVLESILELDEFNNITNERGSDGKLDFQSESFIYLADEANMPYGRYDAENKADFLRELVIKDVLFLTGERYFISPDDIEAQTNKQAVKEIVIACNTATAFGLETVKSSTSKWGLPISITGIIEAGALSAIETIEDGKIEKALIAVLATEGTCSSQGYPNTIFSVAESTSPLLDLEVIQQAGIGLAGAIDGDINYLDKNIVSARDTTEYFGPSLSSRNYSLDPMLLDAYNFEGEGELLIKYMPEGDTLDLQLNSVRNYVRYMVTSLVHNASISNPDRSIDIVILGCTHYPYEIDEIRSHFEFLKKNQKYSSLISDSLVFIDPSKSLAIHLYTSLIEKNLLGDNSMEDSEFYISVPNTVLKENIIDENLEFPFEWKYGREINTGLQYVKVVPFSDRWIDADIKERIKNNLPLTYDILK